MKREFKIKGCIMMIDSESESDSEMAWIMGFQVIKFRWLTQIWIFVLRWMVDSKTNEPVDDKEVKGRYEKDLLLHAGVRLIGKYYMTFLIL